MTANRYIAASLSLCLLLVSTVCQASPQATSTIPAGSATADQQALDKLLSPIALYPDALLAQVLACSTSPQQVTEVSRWLEQNKNLQGTQLQEAANQQGFDASFVALVLFPDVLGLMAQNMEWTTEVGKAFLSDQEAVLGSVQRLRAQAQAMGNLKTNSQQTVSTQTQDGTQVIIVQPANPQVVYVPQYTQTVYTTPAPAPTTQTTSSSSSDKTVAAALIGFGLGVALGAAMNDDYYYGPYGWGAWGVGWHTHTVVVVGNPWRVPPRARYPYTRPVPYGTYRAPRNVYAPTNINVNVNRPTYNVNRDGTTPTARPATRPAAPSTQPATAQQRSSAARPQAAAAPAARSSNYGSRGYASAATPSAGAARPASQARSGTSSGAFSGYQSGQSERAASARGRKSSSGGRRERRPNQ